MDVRVAVVGCGAWGANHLRVFAGLEALAMACEADVARAADVRSRYPDVTVVERLEDVLSSDEVSAVVLATPAVTHAALAEEVLRAGKDLLVEKPMALASEEADALVSLAEASGRILAVGHVLEYHPAVRRLASLVAAGDLGRLRYVYSNRLNFGRIRTEENVLWSFAPHDIAIMIRLLESVPIAVACHGSSHVSASVADVTLTHLTFPNGVQGHIYVSWIHPFKEHRLVVVGERRMAVFDDSAPWAEKLTIYDHAVDWMAGQIPVARKAAGESVQLEEAEPLVQQAEAFLEAVRTRRPPIADARSGAVVLSVLTAAQRSLDRGGLPETPGVGDATSIHPTAVVDQGARVGSGTKIWHFCHVMGEAVIGNDSMLGQNVFVGAGVRIGDRVRIQNNVSVYEGVSIEDGVFCGPSVVFTNVKNPRAGVDRRDAFLETNIREGASLGANSTIVCGTQIGRYAFVAAGAVVTHDVADHALVMGSPARPVGWMCRCGERLEDGDEVTCQVCGRAYAVVGDRLTER